MFTGTRRTRKWIAGIKAAGGTPDLMRVMAGAGKDGHTIERPAGRNHAGGAKQASSRLEANQVVESRWDAPRPGGIGAERKRYEPLRHGYCWNRTLAARNLPLIEQAGAGATWRAP